MKHAIILSQICSCSANCALFDLFFLLSACFLHAVYIPAMPAEEDYLEDAAVFAQRLCLLELSGTYKVQGMTLQEVTDLKHGPMQLTPKKRKWSTVSPAPNTAVPRGAAQSKAHRKSANGDEACVRSYATP